MTSKYTTTQGSLMHNKECNSIRSFIHSYTAQWLPESSQVSYLHFVFYSALSTRVMDSFLLNCLSLLLLVLFVVQLCIHFVKLLPSPSIPHWFHSLLATTVMMLYPFNWRRLFTNWAQFRSIHEYTPHHHYWQISIYRFLIILVWLTRWPPRLV